MRSARISTSAGLYSMTCNASLVKALRNCAVLTALLYDIGLKTWALLCRLGMIFCVAQQGCIHALHCLKCSSL